MERAQLERDREALLAFAAPPPVPVARPVTESERIRATKKCPDCAEEIQAAATVCRFCGWGRAAEAPRSFAVVAPREGFAARLFRACVVVAVVAGGFWLLWVILDVDGSRARQRMLMGHPDRPATTKTLDERVRDLERR